jgi:raffinose/stachyose/melibiose transport system permease protein
MNNIIKYNQERAAKKAAAQKKDEEGKAQNQPAQQPSAPKLAAEGPVMTDIPVYAHSHHASIRRRKIVEDTITYSLLIIAAAVVVFPLILVLMNSLKTRNYIATEPFSFPNATTFAGFDNYKTGIEQSQFFLVLLNSFYITIASTFLIIILTSMAAWFLVRVKTWWTKVIYYVIIFSMIVPFQMVMLPLSGVAAKLKLDNIWGIVVIYVGFGAGLSTFMYAGFVKSVPEELEEAAMIDGCNPLQIFFRIVFPVLKPTTITISILNVMWIWNDYLLPYMVIGNEKGKTTVPVAIQQAMSGSYGDINYGAFMAMIVLTIIPIVIFYLFSQKYIIKGVVAGAVKG